MQAGNAVYGSVLTVKRLNVYLALFFKLEFLFFFNAFKGIKIIKNIFKNEYLLFIVELKVKKNCVKIVVI